MTIRNTNTAEIRADINSGGISRRNFLRAAGALAILTESHFAWAQIDDALENPESKLPNDAVLINANENPLGPSQAARAAIIAMAPKGGRFDRDGETAQLTQVFCDQNGLKPNYVSVYAGSSEPLHFAALAFCSPGHAYVSADPTYEAGERAARLVGAKTKLVPLLPNYSHNVKAMAAADDKAGLIYVCNPNNPTGTLTSYDDIVWLLDNKPKGSVVVVDEAYIQMTNAVTVIGKVTEDKDLIVLRTFSKLYGMAGIRCGLAIGRPDLLAKLAAYGINSMPITASAAARASLLDMNIVPRRKRIIGDIRQNVFTWLQENNYNYIPSSTNCFMLDVKRPGQDVVLAMQQRNVYIGRVWPIMPTYVRVTVGSTADMESFKTALQDVMQNAPKTTGMVDRTAHIPFSRQG
jgi:histidinol-phosphate aminotransferase